MTEAAELHWGVRRNADGKTGENEGVLRCFSGKLLLVAAAGSYLAAAVWLRRFVRPGRGGQTVPVLLRCEGRRQLLRALVDTGNTLTDPVTGAPVLVADRTVTERLFPKGRCPTEEELRRPAQSLEQLSQKWDAARLRLLPYRSVGVESGLLLAVRVDEIEVDGRCFPGKLVALMPGILEEDVHGLIGMA